MYTLGALGVSDDYSKVNREITPNRQNTDVEIRIARSDLRRLVENPCRIPPNLRSFSITLLILTALTRSKSHSKLPC